MKSRWIGLFALGFSLSGQSSPVLDALDEIVDRDPRVGQQKAALAEVRGSTLPDRLGLLPTLSGTLSTTAEGADNSPTTSRQRAGLSLGLNLFRFGADLARRSAAGDEIESAQWSLKDTVLKVEADGVQTLFSLFAAKEKVSVLQQILKTRQQTLEVARERFKRGLVAQEEVSATEIDLENARAQFKDAEVEQIAAQNQLQALLGKTHSLGQWPWRESLTEIRFPLGQQDELKNRPDWQAARTTRLAAEERQDQAWGGIFPSLDASLDYGFLRTRFQGLTSEGPQWSGTLSLTIPLFDRLSNIGTYRAATARSAAADERWTGVKRQALQEWQTAEDSLKVSRETAQSREKTLTIARRLYEANLNRFNRGLVNANELRVDQDRFYQSELFAIQGWNAAHLNLVQLCHSLGKRVRECLHAKTKPR